MSFCIEPDKSTDETHGMIKILWQSSGFQCHKLFQEGSEHIENTQQL